MPRLSSAGGGALSEKRRLELEAAVEAVIRDITSPVQQKPPIVQIVIYESSVWITFWLFPMLSSLGVFKMLQFYKRYTLKNTYAQPGNWWRWIKLNVVCLLIKRFIKKKSWHSNNSNKMSVLRHWSNIQNILNFTHRLCILILLWCRITDFFLRVFQALW